jgi:hypothetical protein
VEFDTFRTAALVGAGHCVTAAGGDHRLIGLCQCDQLRARGSNFDVLAPSSSDTFPLNGKKFSSILLSDRRIFEENPAFTSTPSLNPVKEINDQIKLRTIGRKRIGFGKALGDILFEGRSND